MNVKSTPEDSIQPIRTYIACTLSTLALQEEREKKERKKKKKSSTERKNFFLATVCWNKTGIGKKAEEEGSAAAEATAAVTLCLASWLSRREEEIANIGLRLLPISLWITAIPISLPVYLSHGLGKLAELQSIGRYMIILSRLKLLTK